jgi:hypothetical protein
MEGQAKDRPQPVDEAGGSGAETDSERIHGEAEGDEKDFQKTHSLMTLYAK